MKNNIFAVIISILLTATIIINIYYFAKNGSLVELKKDNLCIKEYLDSQKNTVINTNVIEDEYITKEEVAKILGVTVQRLDSIIVKQNKTRSIYTSHHVDRFLKYAVIDGKKIFKRTDINRWLDYNISNYQVIE